jgi:hypothetical protein
MSARGRRNRRTARRYPDQRSAARRGRRTGQPGPFIDPYAVRGRRRSGRGGPVYVPVYGPDRYANRAARRAARRAATWTGPDGTPAMAHAGGRRAYHRGGPSLVSRAPELAARGAWRYRWQLAPVAGGVAVLAAGTVAPVVSVAALSGASVGAWRWAASGRPVRGRMFLSVLERRTLALWTGTAAAWSAWSALPVWGAGSAWTLAAMTAYPSYRWAASRRVRKVHRLSPAAQAVVDRWSEAVALRGPGPLKGSRVVRSTMREPAVGAYAFAVQLAPDVHAKDAATDAGRRGVEVQLKLPVDTATLTPDRDDATRVHVTLTPSRHLETDPPAWEGPQLLERDGEGLVLLADTPDGQQIPIAVYNRDGVEHCFIVGTSGVGKSSTTAAVALPGPTKGLETLWYVDGKQDGSAPYLAPAFDWYAVTPESWGQAIDAAHAVLRERKRRRAGKHRWDAPNEADPILTVLFDEATTVAAAMSSARHAKVLEMLREGRSLGVRIIQVAQDPMGTDLLGGRKARDLMTGNGAVLAHRPGGSLAGRIALDSTGKRNLDLTSLPPEPGFLAIVRRGKVLAPLARVRFAAPDAAGAAARLVTPRSLGADDAKAAGEVYAARRQPAAAPSAAAEIPAQRTEPATEEAPNDAVRLARDVVAETLAGVDRPVSRGWIVRRTGLAPATVSKALTELEDDQLAERVHGQKWQAIP